SGSALAAPFDGKWAVQVIVKSGNCETGYLLPIRVADGRVSYSGQIRTTATGQVSDAGQAAVRFVHGRDVVDAAGVVQGKRGSGRWGSATLGCTGTWIADHE